MLEPTTDRMRRVLSYMREHLNEQLSTEHLASIACSASANLVEPFSAGSRETPAKAVERLRVESRARVERGAEPIELIKHLGWLQGSGADAQSLHQSYRAPSSKHQTAGRTSGC
ncbi:unnamed protein product, partial [Mesorhabditis spiculigera]